MNVRACLTTGTLTLAVAILSGNIVDKTTGQPLTDVEVRVNGAGGVTPAHSDAAGHYTLRGLSPGRHTLTLSSDDVPPQTFEVVINGNKPQHFDMTACSTTLDYSCAAAQP